MDKALIDTLFFELIRVAIGTQESLSQLPKAGEWSNLYKMAQKQSLVGICFVALQRLGADADEGFARIGMGEMQYLTWMGMAVKIQQKNDEVNQQCAELQSMLLAEGLGSCVLKGQGVAALYESQLTGLRQSGDIDVWIKNPFEKIMDYVQKVAPSKKVNRIHVKLHIFDDTEVEIHFTPVRLKCPWRDRKLQKWLNTFENENFEVIYGFKVAPLEMNVVYIPLHIFKHLFNEGIGLRQVIDYYFVLRRFHDVSPSINTRTKIQELYKQFGILRFGSAMMWIMREVFGMSEQLMLCTPDEKLGRMILRDIVQRGNFGHGDERIDAKEGIIKRFIRTTKMSMKYLPYFTAEVIWLPWYRFTQRLWMLRHGYK